ncbi:MAG: hypothetical protein DWH97_05715 [Planctomycetota bacterium]|nr:MAG: hypothetical protein DWH97_05715 [Planctomycetota bacterium]
MRAMSIPRVRLDWSLRVTRLIIACVAASLVTTGLTVIPPWWHERGSGAQITQIFRGHHGWWSARDEVFAMRWSNLQLMQETLGSPIDAGELPAWAEPPPPPYPQSDFYRVATLAVGWPFPTRTFRWVAPSHEHNFPIAAELDDADTSIVYAAEDARTHVRAGGPTQRGCGAVSALMWRFSPASSWGREHCWCADCVISCAVSASSLSRECDYSAGNSGSTTSTSR